MRDRLIELLEKADETVMGFSIDGDVSRLADHLLAEGVIVTPCKVGDKAYVVDDLSYGIAEGFISKLEYNFHTTPQEWITVKAKDNLFGWYEKKYRIDRVLGKTVFLTKEEAEKALAERREKWNITN